MLGLWRQAWWSIWDGWACCPNQFLQKIIVLKYCFLWKYYLDETFLLPILMCITFFFLPLIWNYWSQLILQLFRRTYGGRRAAPTRSNCALRAKQEHREPSPICCSTEGMVVGSHRHGFAAWHCAAWPYCCYCCVRESHFQFIIGKSWPVSSTAT